MKEVFGSQFCIPFAFRQIVNWCKRCIILPGTKICLDRLKPPLLKVI